MKLSNILSRKNRILLRELIITDFKLRYQGSALGYVWSILKPLFLFAIMYFVFGFVFDFRGSVEHFAVYLLVGIVLWSFFTEATTQGLQAIVSRGDLIRKINFPKYIIIVSGTTSALINLFFNLLVIFFFMFINGVTLSWTIFLLPLIILELYIFALALAFFLSAFNVRYRDIGYLWEILLQALFYATPILYSISLVIDKSHFIAQLMLLSPVTQTIQDARYVLISHQTVTPWNFLDAFMEFIPLGIVAVSIIIGALYFRKSSKYFAEYV